MFRKKLNKFIISKKEILENFWIEIIKIKNKKI